LSIYTLTISEADLAQRLPGFNQSLYRQVRQVLDQNKAERHIRGGLATKEKYQARAKARRSQGSPAQ
jgi:hypothetical protein